MERKPTSAPFADPEEDYGERGEVPPEFKEMLHRVQEKVFQEEPSEWKTLNYVSGVKISGHFPKVATETKKSSAKTYKILVGLFTLFYLLDRYVIDMPWMVYGVISAFLMLKGNHGLMAKKYT